jgi:mannose-6-phosphate isomerase
LHQWFPDQVPDAVIGEAWVVSGLPGMAGAVTSGAPAGYTLDRAWSDGLVTGSPRDDDFPLLCKFLDPADWLSVQVHPDDEQAERLEGEPRGKAECWYVLDAVPGAELIMGHRRESAEQLARDLAAGDLMDQLVTHPVHSGSFFMVPAGCVHAVGPGVLVYEVQQSSDITYRLYDFDRVGADGSPRDLHVDKGFSVVTAPFDPATSLTAEQPRSTEFGSRRLLVANEHFSVQRWDIDGAADITPDRFRVLTVIEGSGQIESDGDVVSVRRGTSMVIPTGVASVRAAGAMAIMTTDPGPGL